MEQERGLKKLLDIVFQREDIEEMDLFAKIYHKINFNEKERVAEDDRINNIM
jgi:hypothetical protein